MEVIHAQREIDLYLQSPAVTVGTVRGLNVVAITADSGEAL